jgi:hypothetical protein
MPDSDVGETLAESSRALTTKRRAVAVPIVTSPFDGVGPELFSSSRCGSVAACTGLVFRSREM